MSDSARRGMWEPDRARKTQQNALVRVFSEDATA